MMWFFPSHVTFKPGGRIIKAQEETKTCKTCGTNRTHKVQEVPETCKIDKAPPQGCTNNNDCWGEEVF